jgi:predicted amidohydrolase
VSLADVRPDAGRTVLPLLRVAAVQAVSMAGDVPANVASAAAWVQRAADAGAALVVLPELFLSGYDPDTQRADPDGCDVTPEDARLDPLRAAAAEAEAAVLVGAAVRQADQTRTVSVLAVDRDGRCSVPYSKQHLWDEERAIFVPGTAGGSLCLGSWEVGLGICYDGCFPEHARAASEAGALAYACPSAYVVGSEHRRDVYYAARALDNGIYVVFAGLVGRCGALEFSGGTAIYDPQGRAVARVPEVGTPAPGGDASAGAGSPGIDAGEAVEGMTVADLDPEEIAEARRINPFAHDRPIGLGGRIWTTLS